MSSPHWLTTASFQPVTEVLSLQGCAHEVYDGQTTRVTQ